MTIRATCKGWPGILWANILPLSAVTGRTDTLECLYQCFNWVSDSTKLLKNVEQRAAFSSLISLVVFPVRPEWCVFTVLTPKRRPSASVKWAQDHLRRERSVCEFALPTGHLLLIRHPTWPILLCTSWAVFILYEQKQNDANSIRLQEK